MSPTGNWLPAKNKLKAEVHKILTVLKHKQLPLKKSQYTINSVLMAKLRYVLLIVPMTDAELDDIDNQIAAVFKNHMRLARSSSSPLLFMHTRGMGSGLSSVRDMRDTLLIEAAHMILNDRDNTLYAFAHSRLESLRDTLGWTHSPLNSPQDVPAAYFHKHWFARVANSMAAHSITSSDKQGFLRREGSRYHDTPIHEALGHPTYAPIRHHLTTRGIYWVGQISTHTQAGHS